MCLYVQLPLRQLGYSSDDIWSVSASMVVAVVVVASCCGFIFGLQIQLAQFWYAIDLTSRPGTARHSKREVSFQSFFHD